jgi:hypothetical protein
MQPKANKEKGNTIVTTNTLTKADLAQFTGSETWDRQALARDLLLTEGAKHVADVGGAYRLLDEIALAQRCQPRVAAEEFQVWTLKVKDAKATLATTATATPPIRSGFRSQIFRSTRSASIFATTRSCCRASIDRGRGRPAAGGLFAA